MKISLLSIIFLILVQLTLNAQEKYIIISGGLTKPLADFADNDFDNSDAGFATNGYNIGFELGHFFNPWFGIGGSFKFNNSGFDSQRFNDTLSVRFENKADMDTIYLYSGDYNLHNFLAGPYGKIDLGSHFSIFGNAFIGVLSTFRPDQTLFYKKYSEPDPVNLYSAGKLAAAFAWNFGGGILVKVSDGFGIVLKADYIASNPEFEVFDYETLLIVKEVQAVRYVNFNIGLTLRM